MRGLDVNAAPLRLEAGSCSLDQPEPLQRRTTFAPSADGLGKPCQSARDDRYRETRQTGLTLRNMGYVREPRGHEARNRYAEKVEQG